MVEKGRLSSPAVSPDDLNSMLTVCNSQCRPGQMMASEASRSIEAIHRELERREVEQAKKDSGAAAQIGAQRHQETVALDRETIEASHYSNRLSVWAIVVALAALAIAILGWMFPREPHAGSPKESTPVEYPAPFATNG